MDYSKSEIRENKVQAYNRVCKAMNKVASKLEPILEEFVGKDIYKQDETVTKKFKDAVNTVIRDLNTSKPYMSIYIHPYSYSLYLEFKVDYRVAEYGVNYIKKSLNIGTINNGILESTGVVNNAELTTPKTTAKRVEATMLKVEKLKADYNKKLEALRRLIPSEFQSEFPQIQY